MTEREVVQRWGKNNGWFQWPIVQFLRQFAKIGRLLRPYPRCVAFVLVLFLCIVVFLVSLPICLGIWGTGGGYSAALRSVIVFACLIAAYWLLSEVWLVTYHGSMETDKLYEVDTVAKQPFSREGGAGKKRRLLYSFNATGNGHARRAKLLIPALRENGWDVEVAIGSKAKGQVLAYHEEGMKKLFAWAFPYGNGGVRMDLFTADIIITVPYLLWLALTMDLTMFDLVISDWEAVSSVASFMSHVPLIHVGHQAVLHDDAVPKASATTDAAVAMSIGHNCLNSASSYVGFSFSRFSPLTLPPLISPPSPTIPLSKRMEHPTIVVYLPAFSLRHVVTALSRTQLGPITNVHIYTSEVDKDTVAVEHDGRKIVAKRFSPEFAEDTRHALGMLTSGGFESVAEALVARTPLLLIPIENQWEQECNICQLYASIPKHFAPSVSKLEPKLIQPHVQHFVDVAKEMSDLPSHPIEVCEVKEVVDIINTYYMCRPHHFH